jgi:hypothetical protein
VVVLPDCKFIYEFQLGYERSPSKLTLLIEIRDVAHHQVPAVDRGGVALID